MRKPQLIESRDVPLADIHIENRLRELDQAAVDALTVSIQDIGLKDRITLRRVRNPRKGADQPTYLLKLIAGGHRIAVYHQLGRDEIPSDIYECTNDGALLLEIDDNLARCELTPLDKAVFLVRRKEVYERIYPGTANGAKGLAAINGDQTDIMSVWSFVAATSKQMGITERQVRRMIAAARDLSDDEITCLRMAPKPVTIADLEVIAKCEPRHRHGIVFGLAAGFAKSATEALSMMTTRPGDALVDPIDARVRPLSDMFARAPRQVLHRFVRDNAEQLRAILAELEADT